jgi:hypothetical protein
MKKFIFVLSLLCLTNLAHADRWHHGGGHYYWHPGYGWMVPAVVGGAIVYSVTKPPTVIQQQPIYIQQTYPPAQPVFPQPAGYHWEAILDSNCNCYRTVLVPN